MYEDFKGGIGIPKLYWYGTQGDYNILIRELLDDSLDDYFKSCNNKFTLLTILMLENKCFHLLNLYSIEIIFIEA